MTRNTRRDVGKAVRIHRHGELRRQPALRCDLR